MPDTATLGAFPKTARSRVRRLPKRGHYDRETIFSVLDSALHCHVGYVIDGLPYVTPTLFWREGKVCIGMAPPRAECFGLNARGSRFV